MEIINKQGFHAIGIQLSCDRDELFTQMPKLWDSFLQRLEEIPSRKSGKIMDIGLDKNGDRYTQFICVETEDLQGIPEGMKGIYIPTQQYIYMKHSGDIKQMWQAYSTMFHWAEARQVDLDAHEFKIAAYPEDDPFNSPSGYDLYLKVE